MICYYDVLIEENNDPIFAPAPLREYMDRWDGPSFIDEFCLTRDKEVLTFIHFSDKQAVINKAAGLLKSGGRFVLSIDKNQSDVIDYNGRRVYVYPDNPAEILGYIQNANLIPQKRFETEFAYILTAVKPS